MPATETGPAEGTGAAAAAPTSAVESVMYRVMQGTLVKKVGADPSSPKLVKLSRQVGAVIATTGKTWTGPSGGEWVELDATAGKPGWLLIEGPGFDLPGPLLERVEPGGEEPLILAVHSPIDGKHAFDVCLKPTQTVKHAKSWLCLRFPGLVFGKLAVAIEKPGEKTHGVGLRNFPADWILDDGVLMRDTPFKSGQELIFFYVGEATDDMEEAARARGGSAAPVIAA